MQNLQPIGTFRKTPKAPSQKPLKPSNKRSKAPASKTRAKPVGVCELMVTLLDSIDPDKPQISLWIAQLSISKPTIPMDMVATEVRNYQQNDCLRPRKNVLSTIMNCIANPENNLKMHAKPVLPVYAATNFQSERYTQDTGYPPSQEAGAKSCLEKPTMLAKMKFA
jgi:hypothetical protein